MDQGSMFCIRLKIGTGFRNNKFIKAANLDDEKFVSDLPSGLIRSHVSSNGLLEIVLFVF